MKIKLYVDFDGVILNTIDITYELLKDLKIDLKNQKAIREFYRDLDWNDLLKKSTPIRDSINNLKKIINSNLYDVSILSHVVSEKEAIAKKKYLDKHIPNINFIPVDREQNKCDAVDCRNAILIDDYMGNLELWHEKGGIPIKFSDRGKKYIYMTITNLNEMLEKFDNIEELIGIIE